MDDLRVITFDVEHGSNHVILTPNNQSLMIDAGSTAEFSPALHLKNVWGFEALSWLTITHYDSDHLTDINNIDEYLSPTILTRPKISEEHLSGFYEEFSTPLEAFIEMQKRFMSPALPINHPSYDWGGVQFAHFNNEIEDLLIPTANDISVVTFARYLGWTFIFPGDLEKQGWLKLLENDSFRDWLSGVSIFVASHHGRESGFCKEVFDICKPNLVVISDKSTSDTSCTDDYRNICYIQGLKVVDGAGVLQQRRVLTTRNDGAINIRVDASGTCFITTSE